MARSKKTSSNIPANYARIEGSERKPSKSARLIGPADPGDTVKVTIVLRRRPDGPPLPDHDFFVKTPPNQRTRLPQNEFADKYGALPEDIVKVSAFATGHGLNVLQTHQARRTVVVSGTVTQINKAFGVSLGHYQHDVVHRRGMKEQTEHYRGREGFIHIPKDLLDIIVGVFGLDNRRITKHNGNDPPNTTTLSTQTIAQLYNFPTNSASGQTIAIFSEDGFKTSDINSTFGGSPPSVTQITVDASNSGFADAETTQDICIAALAAPGAAIAVYFTTYDQAGWVDLVNRVIHPDPGDPVCSVLSSSFYVANGDDTGTLSDEGVSVSWLNAVTAAFQDAAIQGVTVCIASGDTGTNSKVGDGKAHVQYPASDPWVLSIGGTTIGNVMGSSFDEYVWNDPDPSDSTHWGTTGGGISDFFALPSYQNGAGVPASLNDNHVGRGIPDVAGNASLNAGYSGITVNGSSFTGNGTSASAPLWAGLIAIINAAIGSNVGFVNPALYELGSSYFRDINPTAGPTDNSNGGVSGYPAGAGWDACTGWGSPNGVSLLNGLRAIYNRNFYFIVDKSTFGVDEVSDVINTAGGLYTNAFWIELEGFSINQIGSVTPALSGTFDSITGISVFMDSSGPEFEMPGDLYTPQRIRFPYNIIFTTAALSSFPGSNTAPQTKILSANININGSVLAAEALFELTSGADPVSINIDPSHNNAFYLSQDLRVFSAAAGETPLPGGPAFNSDPYASIQNLLGFLNSNAAFTNPGPDPLNALPGQTGYETGDSSVTPLNISGNKNYNFALARVRLQDSPLATANSVRVFFRLFVAQSCDTDFQPLTTYKSTLGTSGDDNGKPVFPQPSGTGLTDPSGQSIQTIPFFATDASGAHDYDSSVSNANIRNIQIPSNKDKVWAYYGCYLDVYNSSNQSKFPGTHHCIVAEIAYDFAQIINANGITLSPENSDKLAQRNLQITSSGNPGYPDTHRIPQAFDIRPSSPAGAASGQLLNYPDELMIDWGNVPAGSTASLFWPQISAHDLLKLATDLYGIHHLSASDPNTIQCTTVKGVTYIPIPYATGKNFAGLITVDLPNTVNVGQEFNINVRRITSRKPSGQTVVKLNSMNEAAGYNKERFMRNWRYITGTFQVKIPVGIEAMLLPSEENTLAVLKWRLDNMPHVSRWYPVLQRYVKYVSGRVDGFGGDSSAVQPSLTGVKVPVTEYCEEKYQYTGTVCQVMYDCFGNFEGFVVRSCSGERLFKSRERGISEIVLRACKERMMISIGTEKGNTDKIIKIILRC